MLQRKNIKLIQLIDQKTGQTEPYILEMDLVGKGYYGAVYRAVHQHNPARVYAVKVITLKRQESRQEILKQLEIIQKIPKSPNLVDTHKQHLQSKKNLYIFQEFCQGGSLAEFKQKMQGKLMREQVAFDLFYQLGRGYLDLYYAGIIHEDIKPSNILLKGKLYKYCDFGVSQLASNLKYEQSRKGTVSYMPPQKLYSKFKPSAKSDIFSLGVTLYEVIFGFHPYLKKKTKNTKQYLTVLHVAQLAPSHQLLRRIYNPTLKMNKLINLLQGMICRKHELRMSIQELKDVLFNQQPFKSMSIPQEDDNVLSTNTENKNNIPQQQQQLKHINNYSKIQITPYINQSKVFVIPMSKKKCSNSQQNNNNNNLQQQHQQIQYPQQQQNRLFSTNIQLLQQQSSQQYKNKLQQQQLKVNKIVQQEQRKALDEIFRQYHCIQTVITYLNAGVKVMQQVYNQLQGGYENYSSSNNSNDRYFSQLTLINGNNNLTQQQLQLLQNQSPCEIIHFLVLKLSVQLMTKFSKSILNFEKFYQQVPIWQQVEYLQAQVSKFVADHKNIKQLEVKKMLISLCKEFRIREYCDVLVEEFKRMFENVVVGNSVRVNFKDDLLNGLFLLHVKEILFNLQNLPTLLQQPQNQQKQQQQQKNPLQSQHLPSSPLSLSSTFTLIQQTTTKYNQFIKLRRQRLKQQFYKQFECVQNIMYDIQQNDQEFVNLQDQQLLDSDQQQQQEKERGGNQDGVGNGNNGQIEMSQIFQVIDYSMLWTQKVKRIEQGQEEKNSNNMIIDV